MSDGHKKPGQLIFGRTTAGDNVPVQVLPDGTLGISASISGADGAIQDGVNSAIRATVKDYTNSNPLAVVIVDTNGDPTGGSAVTVADGADVAEGAKANAAATDSTSAWSVISLLKGLYAKLAGTLTVDASTVPIPILQNAVVDSGNSSTTPLAGNATFTGSSFDALKYGFVDVTVESDKDSASNGVQIQFSGDNTNWDDSSIFNFVAGIAAPNAGNTFACGLRARYYRVVYTNGSQAQTNFRLFTLVRVVPPGADITDFAVAPTLLNHGLLTRSAIVGKSSAGGGTLVDVKVNPSGTLQVDASNSTGLSGTITNGAGASAINVQDGGNSLTVDGTVAVTNAGLSNLDVALSTRLKPADTLTKVATVDTITNVVHVDDNGGSLTVDGSVTVSGSVSFTAPQHVIVDSGSLTVGNAAGASAVNIQDGGNSITVDGTVAVTQSTSPWVTSNNNAGGASAVNIQDGGNSITVDGSVTATVSGSVTVSNAAGASAVNIQDGGNSITVDGTVTTSPPADATTNLTKVGGTAVALGQTTMSASIPVVIASNQSSLPITAVSLPLPANAAQETGGNLATLVAQSYVDQAVQIQASYLSSVTAQIALAQLRYPSGFMAIEIPTIGV